LEQSIAPKGLENSAQGFNPGNHPTNGFALKGREVIPRLAAHRNELLAPFQGASLRGRRFPGLKPPGLCPTAPSGPEMARRDSGSRRLACVLFFFFGHPPRRCQAPGRRGINAHYTRVFDGRVAVVPEGQADRSQARSAWDNATPKSRPVGYGVIRAAVRADSMIGVTKFQIRRLKTLMLSVGLAAPDQTVPYGTVLWRDAFPGTSCLATIMLSLRDKGHFAHRAGPRHTCSFREASHLAKAPSVRRKELFILSALWPTRAGRSSRRKSKSKRHWCFKARREA